MKRHCIIFLWICIITVTSVGFAGVFPTAQKSTVQTLSYLRMHIRADSNEQDAQAVKYLVRDAVVEYLTPVVVQYQDALSAKNGLQQQIPALAALACKVLKENGFCYGATVDLRMETFPTRVYKEYVLPQGEYMALVIELGRGKGDNWWCVAYPPLCFTSTQNVVYKSKILEIIQRWKNG